MDYLRWILLAVGLLFIGVVYLVSRKRARDRQEYRNSYEEDLPEVSTNWDDLDEAVGEVRIIARHDDDIDFDNDEPPGSAVNEAPAAGRSYPEAFDEPDAVEAGAVRAEPQYRTRSVPQSEPEPDPEPYEPERTEHERTEPEATPPADEAPDEAVLVLNIIAREPSKFSGASINSVATANGLRFGEFNIYHRMDDNGRSLFSLVNMLKPGSFDPDTMHDMKTTGIALFMQLPGPDRPSDAFDQMLLTAHRIAEMLEGRLCDGRRQPLTESEVDRYRHKVAAFDGG